MNDATNRIPRTLPEPATDGEASGTFCRLASRTLAGAAVGALAGGGLSLAEADPEEGGTVAHGVSGAAKGAAAGAAAVLAGSGVAALVRKLNGPLAVGAGLAAGTVAALALWDVLKDEVSEEEVLLRLAAPDARPPHEDKGEEHV